MADDAKLTIQSVTIAPNPVYTGGQITITADIQPPVYYVVGGDGSRIVDENGSYVIADIQSPVQYAVTDNRERIVDENGNYVIADIF